MLRVSAGHGLDFGREAWWGAVGVAAEGGGISPAEVGEGTFRKIARERVKDRQRIDWPAAERQGLAIREPDARVIEVAGVMRREGVDRLDEFPVHGRQHCRQHLEQRGQLIECLETLGPWPG